MTTCTEREDCPCEDCAKNRIDFATWCAETEARWAKAKAEGKVACVNALCPEHGDVRDTSVMVAR